MMTLDQQNGPDIVVQLDAHQNGRGMCTIALLKSANGQTMSVKKVVEYFNGHTEMDRAFNWGVRWTTGSK
ncbi:hypothetical protein [Peribacillus asahii]|uniref:Tellurium resistance protein TerA n=2 Tax=Peribacillus asahii TaxID=228899 RepID=A0A3Q9RNA5_9BACI|nr:hypothetical protein [Peribacillus asahii]AZV43139.1 tellurium resistance protein TerA [Peribacillus asahii]USK83245.1 hypothetical protein LIT35_12105 [Peribacillus asahii]